MSKQNRKVGAVKKLPKSLENKLAKLTVKQRKFLLGLAEGKNQGQAAIDAGYSIKTCDSIVSQELKKPKIKQVFSEIMEVQGISDAHIIGKIKSGMDATKPISGISGGDANGGTVDFIEVPDHPSQFKYTELACKLKGHLKDSNADVNITFNLGDVLDRAEAARKMSIDTTFERIDRG